MRCHYLLILVALCALARGAQSEDLNDATVRQLLREVAELKGEVHSMRAKLSQQQAEIERLRAAPNNAVPAPSLTPEAVPGSPTSRTTASFVPEIGVVGDMLGTVSDTIPTDEGNDRVSVRELELVFGHDVDPYARLDATISFSDSEQPEVEEAYASYWGLPLDLKGRIGRFRPWVGKAAAVHRDILETVDEPLVVQEFFGKEGYFRSGLDFTGFSPLSGDAFTQRVSLGLLEGGVGDGGQLFGDTPNRPTFYARLANSYDVSDSSNAEVGSTYLLGSATQDPNDKVNAFGVDATYLHFFLF